MVPADDQAIVLPCASVMVIIVLLKVAFTCATPDAMFLRSRLRTRVASLPILDSFRGPAPTWRSPSRSRIDPRSTFSCARRKQPAGAAGIACSPGRLLLLAGDRLGRTLAGAGVGMGALTAHRQAAAMPQPPVAAKVH